MKLRSSRGFSLPELMVSVSIVLIVILGFTTLLTAITSTASTAQFQRDITRLLDKEHKALAGVSFDNLMITPLTPGLCELADGRVSTQSVGSSPTTHLVENTEVTVSRSVIWSTTGDPVQCVEGFATRDEDKTVVITATWMQGTVSREQTSQIRYSQYSSIPVEPRLTVPAESITQFVDLQSATGWCPLSSTVEVDDTDDVNLSFRFTNPSELTCGYTLSGLTPGTTYTAVMQVQVPVGATAVITNEDGFVGTVAVGDGGMQYISLTFMAFNTSNEILLGVQSDLDYSLQPSVKLFDFRVYG